MSPQLIATLGLFGLMQLGALVFFLARLSERDKSREKELKDHRDADEKVQHDARESSRQAIMETRDEVKAVRSEMKEELKGVAIKLDSLASVVATQVQINSDLDRLRTDVQSIHQRQNEMIERVTRLEVHIERKTS